MINVCTKNLALQTDRGNLRNCLKTFVLSMLTMEQGNLWSQVIRRLTAQTIAQQLGPAVEVATAPFQYALSTRAGCECVSHALQALCDMDEDATITSIDGISAYDTISRRAMLQGLEKVPGGSAASPFVRLFCAEPSTSFGRMMLGPPTGSIKAKGVSRRTR